MEYLGPASNADVEDDLALSEGDDPSMKHCPPLLAPHNNRELATDTVGPHPRPLALVSNKSPIEHSSDTSSAPLSPVAKTSKLGDAHTQHSSSDYPVLRPLPLRKHAIFLHTFKRHSLPNAMFPISV